MYLIHVINYFSVHFATYLVLIGIGLFNLTYFIIFISMCSSSILMDWFSFVMSVSHPQLHTQTLFL